MCTDCDSAIIETRPAAGFLRAVGVRCSYAGPAADVAALTIRNRLPASGPVLAVEQPDGGLRLIRLPPGHDANQAAHEAVQKSGCPVAVGEVAYIGSQDDVPLTLVSVGALVHQIHTEAELYEGWQPTGTLGRLAVVQKAAGLDPLTPGGFDRIVAALSAMVRQATGKLEATALDAWLRGVGFRWNDATEAQLLAASRSLNAAIQGVAAPAWESAKGKLRVSAQKTATGARLATVDAHRWPISTSLSAPDRAAIARSVATNAHYIRDYYGKVSSPASEQMRGIVQQGIEEGLGTHDIGRNIKRGVGRQLGRVGDSYYNVVSSAVTGRSRSFSQLGSFRDAGISRYVYEAVLDEVVTATCAFLHGQTMEVGAGLARYAAADQMAKPTDIQYEMPWTTERVIQDGGDEGKRGIYIPGRDGMQLMAVIERQRSGKDDRGEYSKGMSPSDLKNAHIGPPPLHMR